MADTTTDEQSNRPIDGESHPPMQETEPTNIPRYARGHLSKDFDDYQVHQQIQIEQETLKFLKKSRKFKRPPQSIRITGANVIEETERLIIFSKFETELLEYQIKQKENRIKELKAAAKEVPFLRLPEIDRTKLYKHYKKKLKFYYLQDNTKWISWPTKPKNVSTTKINPNKKKLKNFKKKLIRRTRKTKHDAKKAIESGAVVVLVDEDIPAGALAVLGKGFGFVPTPETVASDERLDMRRTVNRILTESRKRCSDEYADFDGEDIPAQLRSVSYSLRTPAPDKQVNTLVERLVAAHDAALLNNRKKKNKKSNLSKNERDGLKWLKVMSSEGKISIVQADKGGAILIVHPELLKKKVLEKLENPELYTKLTEDPLGVLKKELFELWKVGKLNKYVSEKQRMKYQASPKTTI